MNNSAPPIGASLSKRGIAVGRPKGLAGIPQPDNGPGCSIAPRTIITSPRADDQAAKLQRGEGRWPSGKTSNTNVTGRNTAGIQSHEPNQTAHWGMGEESGSKVKRAAETAVKANSRPPAMNIQPIGLRGRREPISAPNTEKPVVRNGVRV